MFGAILKATNSSFQKGMTFHVRVVLSVLRGGPKKSPRTFI